VTGKIQPEIFDVTVRNIQDFGNDTRHFELYYDPGRSMNFIAGQFVSVLLPYEGKLIRRAYSIASSPLIQDHFELCIKLVQEGIVTNWFWSLKGGERFQIHGPFGKFILPDPVDFDVVFISAGTGIAPFRSMIPTLLHHGFQRKIGNLFGTRYHNLIPYHEEFLEFGRKFPNLTYIPTISRPGPDWTGETGYVQTKIAKFLPPDGKHVYICGLNAMIQAVQAECLKHGYTKDQIHYERYD
jgi:ferredoxin-NADP reductase